MSDVLSESDNQDDQNDQDSLDFDCFSQPSQNSYTQIKIIDDWMRECGPFLNAEQAQAMTAFVQGRNVLIYGPGGCGKSYWLKKAREFCVRHEIYTDTFAPTNVAAFNVEGATFHSKIPIPFYQMKNSSIEKVKEGIKHFCIKYRKKRAIIFVDECFSCRAELFDFLEEYCKNLTRNYEKLFGNVQIVLMGDMYQLPPVYTEIEKTTSRTPVGYSTRCFVFNRWFEQADFSIHEFFQNHRQLNLVDKEMMDRVRKGSCLPSDIKLFNDMKIQNFTFQWVFDNNILFMSPLNDVTNEINRQCFRLIKNQQTFIYTPTFTTEILEDNIHFHERRSFQHEIDVVKKHCKFATEMQFKATCRVMLITNHNDIIKGTCGTIIALNEGSLTVQFDTGIIATVGYTTMKMNLSEDLTVLIRQIPFIIAYASTIHSMQSLQVSVAAISCVKMFCEGLFYVAISRVKTKENIYLLNFNESCIKKHKDAEQIEAYLLAYKSRHNS